MEGRFDALKTNYSRKDHGVAYIGMVVFRRLKA